jgi:hypothetical protein
MLFAQIADVTFWEGTKMRRLATLVLLAFALPALAGANPIAVTNQNGTIYISAMAGTDGLGTIGISTISTQRSQLTSWNRQEGALGYVSFSTGVLQSGSVAAGGTFAGGGSFDIVGVGKWAKVLTGMNKSPITLFDGSFAGPTYWILTSEQQGTLTYTLSGEIEGTLYTGREVYGSTIQNISFTSRQGSRGIGHLGVGHVQFGSRAPLTPEPGTMGLMGTGLALLAGMFCRKLTA